MFPFFMPRVLNCKNSGFVTIGKSSGELNRIPVWFDFEQNSDLKHCRSWAQSHNYICSDFSVCTFSFRYFSQLCCASDIWESGNLCLFVFPILQKLLNDDEILVWGKLGESTEHKAQLHEAEKQAGEGGRWGEGLQLHMTFHGPGIGFNWIDETKEKMKGQLSLRDKKGNRPGGWQVLAIHSSALDPVLSPRNAVMGSKAPIPLYTATSCPVWGISSPKRLPGFRKPYTWNLQLPKPESLGGK